MTDTTLSYICLVNLEGATYLTVSSQEKHQGRNSQGERGAQPTKTFNDHFHIASNNTLGNTFPIFI